MTTPIVYGMAFATMEYFDGARPLLTAAQALAQDPLVDGVRRWLWGA